MEEDGASLPHPKVLKSVKERVRDFREKKKNDKEYQMKESKRIKRYTKKTCQLQDDDNTKNCISRSCS